jgi:DNA repair exonuclease SbcCD nuclease subunit
MQYPYAISSDQHHHNWSAFSKVNPDGVNSRLRIILDENERAARTVKAAGGNQMFLAGDLFHVRGKIEPSVFNPTVESFERICGDVGVYAIPGNHDLEGRDASKLGNAMQSLANIPNFQVATEPKVVGDVIVYPWYHDLNELRAQLKKDAHPNLDAIIHAPVNGVLEGLPDHGLNADELAAYGFRRIFAGHYHDHQVLAGGKVISIGATTHQTWSDVGTKAGFLLVYKDRIEHVPSQAPQFVDLNEKAVTEADINGFNLDDLVKGNYVRLKLSDVDDKEVRSWRDDTMKAGALGVNIIVNKTATVSRSGASTKAAISLAASVQHYIDNDLKPTLAADVSKLAQDVLIEAQS